MATFSNQSGLGSQSTARNDTDMIPHGQVLLRRSVQTDSEDELVAQVSAHALSVHDVALSHTDVLAMANIAED